MLESPEIVGVGVEGVAAGLELPFQDLAKVMADPTHKEIHLGLSR